MNAALSLTDGLKHVVKLLLTGIEQGNLVVVCETHTILTECIHNDGVANLRTCGAK